MNALGGLPPAETHMLAEPRLARHRGTQFAAHQRTETRGKLALRLVRMAAVQLVGDDQPEDPIAKEFKPLIVGALVRAARMGQCTLEQRTVVKLVSQPLGDGSKFGFRQTLHKFTSPD